MLRLFTHSPEMFLDMHSLSPVMSESSDSTKKAGVQLIFKFQSNNYILFSLISELTCLKNKAKQKTLQGISKCYFLQDK